MREYRFRIFLKNGMFFEERVSAICPATARQMLCSRYPDAREVNYLGG